MDSKLLCVCTVVPLIYFVNLDCGLLSWAQYSQRLNYLPWGSHREHGVSTSFWKVIPEKCSGPSICGKLGLNNTLKRRHEKTKTHFMLETRPASFAWVVNVHCVSSSQKTLFNLIKMLWISSKFPWRPWHRSVTLRWRFASWFWL